MFEDDGDDNIIKLGLILIVTEAVILITFYFLATPIQMLLYGLITSVVDFVPEMNTYGWQTITIFNMMFAIAMILPIAWFLLRISRVESGYNIYRRW